MKCRKVLPSTHKQKPLPGSPPQGCSLTSLPSIFSSLSFLYLSYSFFFKSGFLLFFSSSAPFNGRETNNSFSFQWKFSLLSCKWESIRHLFVPLFYFFYKASLASQFLGPTSHIKTKISCQACWSFSFWAISFYLQITSLNVLVYTLTKGPVSNFSITFNIRL